MFYSSPACYRQLGHLWDFTIYPRCHAAYRINKMFKYLLDTNIIKQYTKRKRERRKKSRGGKEEERNLKHSRNLLNWFSVCVCAPNALSSSKETQAPRDASFKPSGHVPLAPGSHILMTQACPSRLIQASLNCQQRPSRTVLFFYL